MKSPSDTRTYKYIQLNNNLKCILVSDPTTEKSAAALDVHIGSAFDPREFQGTAHFLEHMLFMGTEKYPSENEYQNYLSKNGGNSNAFTANMNTNY